MKVLGRCVAVLLGLCAVDATAPLSAQTAAASAPAAAPWITHTDSSAILGEQRRIRVVMPSGYTNSTRRYPVLLLLDANDELQFRAAVANVAFLAGRQAIPPMLIVGIENGKDRTRDLTPEPQANGPMGGSGGGGPQFIAYLEKEALPMVRANYRTAPYTVFAGHSLGGLMGVYVAATHPQLAHAVIAMSPSLWVNGESATPGYIRGIATRTASLRLFTSRGAYEPPIDGSTARLASGLADALKSRPNNAVSLQHVRYDGDSHNLTPLASLVEGLRWIFADYSMAVSAFDKVPDLFGADSARLVAAVGEAESMFTRSVQMFPPSLIGRDSVPVGFMPVENYTGLSPIFTQLKLPGAGVATFTRALQAYPDNPRLYRSRAGMHMARGDTSRAVADLEKALSLSTSPATATLKGQLEAQLGAIRKARGGT